MTDTQTHTPTGTPAGALDRDVVAQAVTRALEETLGRPLTDVEDATSLFDELGLDSTGVLAVLISLEDQLGIEIDPESVDEDHLATFGGLVDCVRHNGKP
ncbi:acyl carrier protein [Cellulomonas sp. JZ18]|uniref:acyl carrier protein n=1 Tax=Cellulomonas sp. JZ18 TaxID=2654191 RepID=UPI0012D3CE98|nr:acyl carrier protein [Cellulomonas sp. JZ18]QGQ18360.1 acyl carrier protein [Cellulomonas sp. JZ18]